MIPFSVFPAFPWCFFWFIGMILLNVTDLRKHFGPEPVLDGVTFEVRPGDRVGLVGPNGTGKTTLLRILAGHEEADGGSFQFHPTAHFGYLEQQPRFDADRTLRDEAQSALANLVALQQEAIEVAEDIAQSDDPTEQKRLTARYDHLQQELHRRDAYNIDYRVEQVLDGLRFGRETFNQPVASLSGGEQNRLMLAKLLLAEPNLMILDEPSNHLDIDATEWLESFLVESSAALIVVSHDRYFLDRITTRTLELFHGTVDNYVGNFSAYWQQKAERVLVARRTYEKQQIEIEKTKEFIRRNQYGQKHAQAEDRRKKLERIELVTPPREIIAPAMRFPAAKRCGDVVVRAEGVSMAYDRPLFRDVSVDIPRGQRWALFGPNGCGKTTLLRCFLGLVQPQSGSIKLAQGVDIGYFDQQLLSLDENMAVADAIRPAHKQTTQQQRRELLAVFGLTGDTTLQPVGSLSGGERCRASLAKLSMSDANVLVLDEPTNHLDLWARDALEKAIEKFDGTVLFVSHDRYFVNRVADHILAIEPDRIRVVEGNYDEYQRKLRGGGDEGDADAPAEASRPKPSKPSPKTTTKRRFPYRKVADLEEEIFARETAVRQRQQEMLDPNVLRNGDRVREIKQQIDQEQDALKTLYEHWEEASELNW
jgi:ATP-binding cassette subfamily F protein 3